MFRIKSLSLTLSLIALAWAGFSMSTSAAVVTKAVEYKDGETTLRGYVAYDDSINTKTPGVLVFPEWWGLTEHPKKSAEKLAAMGYIAFAADMYGDGKTTTDPKEAGQWSGDVKKGSMIRTRAMAALNALLKQPNVNDDKLAAIGYCFGGTTVLELAYSGAPVQGVVSFHGGLTKPKDADPNPILPKLLILHGAADLLVPEADAASCRATWDAFKANWEMVYYSGAKHAFTNPAADKVGMPQIGYNKQADERSWARMTSFLKELFGK